MYRAVKLWRLIQAGDTNALGRMFTWQAPVVAARPGLFERKAGWRYTPEGRPLTEEEAEELRGQGHRLLETASDGSLPLLTQEAAFLEYKPGFVEPGNMVHAAKISLQREINELLDGVVSPMVLYDLDEQKQVLRFVPKTLLASLWVLFAQAVAGGSAVESCKECGKPFLVPRAEDGRTGRRLYCQDACKFKAYRARLARAKGQAGASGPE
jgi:hypothetical protein